MRRQSQKRLPSGHDSSGVATRLLEWLLFVATKIPMRFDQRSYRASRVATHFLSLSKFPCQIHPRPPNDDNLRKDDSLFVVMANQFLKFRTSSWTLSKLFNLKDFLSVLPSSEVYSVVSIVPFTRFSGAPYRKIAEASIMRSEKANGNKTL